MSNALAEAGSSARVVIFEPDSTRSSRRGYPESTRSRASGSAWCPPLLDLDRFDEVRATSESGAFEMARRVSAEEELLAGGSTGLNVTGAVQLATWPASSSATTGLYASDSKSERSG